MLKDKRKLMTFTFKGYWKDVGTLASFHEANLDVTTDNNILKLYQGDSKKVFTEDLHSRPQYIGKNGKITKSIVNQGATILGEVESSVIFNDVYVDEGAKVTKSVLMPGCYIGKDAKVNNCIVAPSIKVHDKAKVNLSSKEVVLVSKEVLK